MKKIKQLDESGVVSLLSVVIFMIIITVVATSYIKSVISQQKNALNYDLSNRAFYAAEAGIQDGIRALNNPSNAELRANGQQTCLPLNGGDSNGIVGGDNSKDLNLGYTCQFITVNPSAIDTTLTADTNKMIRLKVKDPVATDTYKLVIRWSKKLDSNTPSGTVPLEPRDTAAQDFTNEDQWIARDGLSSSVHPVVRATVISYPNSGGTTRGSITQNVLFLNPVKTNVSGSGVATVTKTGGQSGDSLVQQAGCHSQGATSAVGATVGSFGGIFSCQEIITLNGYDFVNDAVFLRLRSIYGSGTEAQVYLQKDSTPLLFDGVAATIDVTGRANEVFRRVKQTVPINNGISTDTLPEAAVVGGDGICKLYRVGTNAAQFNDNGSCF